MKNSQLTCPVCNCSMMVPNQLIGRQVFCPHCHSAIQTRWEGFSFGRWMISHGWMVLIALVFGIWVAYTSYQGDKENEREQARMDQEWEKLTTLEKHVFFFISDYAWQYSNMEAMCGRIKRDKEAIRARAEESEKAGERLLRPYWWDDKWKPQFGEPFPNHHTADYLLYKRKGWYDGYEHLIKHNSF